MISLSPCFRCWIVTCVFLLTRSNGVVAEDAQRHVATIGNLRVTFRDNGESPQKLSGLDRLINHQDADGFDAYDPDTPGASAGLNCAWSTVAFMSPSRVWLSVTCP